MDIFTSYLPPANEVCEDYVFTSVYLSTGGGMHGRGMHGGGACVAEGRAWWGERKPPPLADTMRYSDTVNERAVCILLECILV